MVEVKIVGLAVDENNQSPVLLLKSKESDVVLPIWIGAMEAMSISLALNKVDFHRPMTHDLTLNIIRELGASIAAVEVTSIKEGTFYAEILAMKGEETLRIDSRPSDAVALGVRVECPILVAEDVLAEAGAPDPGTYETAFKGGDAGDWADELEKLSADETKYKM